MNRWQLIWENRGYARCYARVNRTSAPQHRKHGALMRVWKRKTA